MNRFFDLITERIRMCDLNMDGELSYGMLHHKEQHLKEELQKILDGHENRR